jgi:hypothetical protein
VIQVDSQTNVKPNMVDCMALGGSFWLKWHTLLFEILPTMQDILTVTIQAADAEYGLHELALVVDADRAWWLRVRG